jgi:hypothetical protein
VQEVRKEHKECKKTLSARSAEGAQKVQKEQGARSAEGTQRVQKEHIVQRVRKELKEGVKSTWTAKVVA